MIDFSAVSKRFAGQPRPALQDVSFSVHEGEIFGLLGHNGAGKSTAMGVLLGLVRPDAGSVSIDGVPVLRERERALSRVGSIFESPRFYEYLTGRRNLRILAGYSGYWDADEVEETLAWVGLTGQADQRVATYSQGMRQRLALAQALLPRPRVLLLDEPTNGLDPDGIIELRERIAELRRTLGITVLLNSHLLAEVEHLCDRVAILREGEVVYAGAIPGSNLADLLYDIDSPDLLRLASVAPHLGFEMMGTNQIRLPANTEPSDLLTRILASGIRIREFRRATRSLETLYREVSRR